MSLAFLDEAYLLSGGPQSALNTGRHPAVQQRASRTGENASHIGPLLFPREPYRLSGKEGRIRPSKKAALTQLESARRVVSAALG